MTTYQTILAAVDGSDEAKCALRKAIDMAAKHSARLIIAHVIDTRTSTAINYYDRYISERAEEQAEKLLLNYKEEAARAGLKSVTTVIEHGSPRTRITNVISKEYEADVIVTGATGLNAVGRLLIGSVSEAIVRHARCDVLIVRKDQKHVE
ncbi:universal stress protein [Bacillus piscicola]|uniref:universal stress protein n=1 Tax=Bacillus piscicola TaxID=1632684 RepID=UPI001F097FEB|nr:universal stress protein [Bacillus piscicola]